MEQKKVGIYGFGTMGVGIACVVLEHGYDVVAYDTDENALRKGRERINRYLGKLCTQKEKTWLENRSQENETAVVRIREIFTEIDSHLTTVSTPDFSGCFIVIECVFENKELKQNVFWELGGNETVRQNAILASNTSSIPIHYLANISTRPSNVIGLHFSNPPTHVRGVEVIPARHTSVLVVAQTMEFAKSIGQEPFVVNKDSAGFVGNRLLGSLVCEGCRLLEEGTATPEDIDGIAKKHLNLPYGPLEVADLIGLDVFMHFLEIMAEELPGGERFTPPALLQNLVAKGNLGRKIGKGFYTYPKKS